MPASRRAAPFRAWLPLLILFVGVSACQRGEAPATPTVGAPTASIPPTPAPSAIVQATRTPSPPAQATPTARAAATPNKWGVHLLLDDGVGQWPVEVWDEHLAYARWIVGARGYVVEVIRLDDLDSAKWQGFLDLAARHQLTPIVRLATWQDRDRGHWVAPPVDPDGRRYRQVASEFARFVGELKLVAPLYVTVGNEPNRGDEWGGQPDPAEYARYLLDVSSALRTAAPGRVVILNGALDQYAPDSQGQAINGFRSIDAATFLDGMQAANPRVWDAIDAWAAHTYPLGPFAEHPARREFQVDDLIIGGPRTREAPWPGLYNRGLNSYRWELYKLASYGVKRRLKVYITETGWRHLESQAPSSDRAGAVIPGDLAAEYIRQAFDGDPHLAPQEYTWTPWSSDPDVAAAVLFALDGDPSRWGHTNLLELGPGGEIVGLKSQFASLVKR